MSRNGISGLITCYIDHLKENKVRILIFLTIYIFIVSIACCLGTLLSLGAQRGGITPKNAFIAPLIGPWSQTLPPNSHQVRSWTEGYKLFAQMLTAVLVLSLAGSFLIRNFWLSYFSTVSAVLALIVWVLSGLIKVVSQLA